MKYNPSQNVFKVTSGDLCAIHSILMPQLQQNDFPPNAHKRHSIAHPWRLGMLCLVGVDIRMSPLCKRSGLTLIEVPNMHIYQIRLLVYVWFTNMLIFATWCNWRDFYWCWIKFCLSLSLSFTFVLQLYMPYSFILDCGSKRLNCNSWYQITYTMLRYYHQSV